MAKGSGGGGGRAGTQRYARSVGAKISAGAQGTSIVTTASGRRVRVAAGLTNAQLRSIIQQAGE